MNFMLKLREQKDDLTIMYTTIAYSTLLYSCSCLLYFKITLNLYLLSKDEEYKLSTTYTSSNFKIISFNRTNIKIECELAT